MFFMMTVNMTIHGCCLRSFIRCSVLLSVLTCGSITTWAYEESAVLNGGMVTGTVQFFGELPQPTSFELRRYPDQDYCGALSDGSGYLMLREVAVGPEHGLKDVIVTIQGIEKGKPFEFKETKLETNICQFVPFVSVMRDQHPITVKNLDTIAHDLQVYEREWEHIFMMFHRPTLTKGGTSDLIRFTGTRRGVIMQCGMHPYMQGHGLAVDNPYYAITGLEGTFAIRDLPSGSYRIKAWHPILGEKVQEVTVAANGIASLDFRFKAK
jgi:hypothetical protein